MERYLSEINIDFQNKEFNKWYIDFLRYYSSKYNDSAIYNLFTKYSCAFYDYKSINVLFDESKVLIENYDESLNVLIKSYMSFLISQCSKTYIESKLINNCKEYIKLFFENLNNKEDGFPSHNLVTVLHWTLFKFPNCKELIAKMIYEKVMSDEFQKNKSISVVDYFIRDKSLNNLFSKEQYKNIYSDFLINPQVDDNEIYFYYDVYNDFLKSDFCKDSQNKKMVKQSIIEYVLKHLNKFDYHFNQINLQIIRDYMNELKIYDDNDYLLIDEKIVEANKETVKSLKMSSFQLPKNIQDTLNEKLIEINNQYSEISIVKMIDKLLIETAPLSLNELKRSFESSKTGIESLISVQYLDEDGRVINYKDLTEEENFSLKSRQQINIIVEIYMDLVYSPFYNHFKIDEESKKYIYDIMANNRLISTDRVDYMSKLFVDFFSGNYRNSIYDIISEFEESLRYYFKCNKMNVIKRDGTNDLIGLSNVFNDNQKNSFRDKLYEIIDEDYYFTLKWFLVDDYGFGIRNKIAHRYKSKDLFKNIYSIYIVVQIFRFYWGFQND